MFALSPYEVGVGLSLVLIFTLISTKFKLLTRGGMLAALLVGALVTVFGGLSWLALLLAFHIAASGLTRYHFEAKLKKGAAEPKGGMRSWTSVLANGGVALLFAVFEGTLGGGIFFGGFLGSLASATSDTLATEVGTLYPGQPRLITNLRRKVRAGTSGALSPYGEAAMILGAVILGTAAFLFHSETWTIYKTLAVAVLAGFIGSTVDSLLGAGVQAKFFCPNCGQETEISLHGCGTVCTLTHGHRYLNNHSVNLIATVVGGLTGVLLAFVL